MSIPSQVSGPYDTCCGFGPLVMDGYGFCYNIRSHDLLIATSAMTSNPETDLHLFRDAVQESLHDMHNLAVQNGFNSNL